MAICAPDHAVLGTLIYRHKLLLTVHGTDEHGDVSFYISSLELLSHSELHSESSATYCPYIQFKASLETIPVYR